MTSPTLQLVVPVRFTGGGLAMQTTSSRIGPGGVFVRCLVAPKEGSKVTVALTLPGGARPFEAAGTVAERVQAAGQGKEAGFWVQFEPLSKDARAGLDALLAARGFKGAVAPSPEAQGGRPAADVEPVASQRAFARAPTRLQIGWSSPREFLVAHSENISRGGIFVATRNPPPVREVVELLLELPDGHAPAKTQAEVVQCVSADEAQKTGKTAGAGLQFIGGDEDFRRRVDACIEHLLGKDS
ncbi:MAG TPA: PilZ domain-containing protein [Myxococcales bacterium]|jgi:uncharacterized protein (TIGR02266 family)|nr:PilZ domain-containing protein [Myxococcales bacterium]